jgi:creatinine amidohydrolase/Fe(II)-dependent formamide hydrolase-like protein
MIPAAFRRLMTHAGADQGRLAVGRRALAFAGAGALGMVYAGWRQPAQALTSTREITDMTWIEVRDAIRAGLRTVIVPSGGLEQNGPHMIIGKHDYIVRWAARRIAAELGDALVAPVISYVPEGDYDPPTGNMQWPGTIGVPPGVFAGMLEGIARSLKDAGFTTICFIADHGPSLAPQADVAAKLNQEWAAGGPRMVAVDSYYADAAETAYLRGLGESEAAIGEHATISDTSELMAVHPEGVDLSRLATSGSGLGVVGEPSHSTIARGDAMMAMKVRAAVAQIAAATGRAMPQISG